MTKEFGPEGDPTSLLVCRMLSNFRRYSDLRSPFHPGLYGSGGEGGSNPGLCLEATVAYAYALPLS